VSAAAGHCRPGRLVPGHRPLGGHGRRRAPRMGHPWTCHPQRHGQPEVGASGCPVSTDARPAVPQGSCTWWRWMPSSPASMARPCCGRGARGVPRRSRCPRTTTMGTGVSGGRGAARPRSRLVPGHGGRHRCPSPCRVLGGRGRVRWRSRNQR